MKTVIDRNEVVKAILAEGVPCTGCKHNLKCALDLKACKDFERYVNTGKFRTDTLREPKSQTYMKIFWGGQD